MTHEAPPAVVHPGGDRSEVELAGGSGGTTLDTFGGPLRVEWDEGHALTSLGQTVYFIDFLKTSGLLDAWVGDCPLRYVSPNAPRVRDVLCTMVLSILAGHRRYAHVTALRSDGVLPELLGMKRVASEDSVRRGLKALPEAAGLEWLQRHLDRCTHPLPGEPWILDIDTTVKPLYGHQEGAVVGYNPKKPGRPSHVHHTYMLAGVRLAMGVETLAGNQHTGKHAAPGLWALLDRVAGDCRPTLLRGDAGIGSENTMAEAERRGIDYLFRLRLTRNARRLVERAFLSGDWQDGGQGWEGKQESLRLVGWSRQRPVVVLRRRLKEAVAVDRRGDPAQPRLAFAEIGPGAELYEYAVLATTLEAEVVSIAQLYRDRGDCENVFDELKNQWGRGGFTTRDLARCRLTAKMVALVYDWWNLFTRLAEPDKHLEAITSRPLLLAAIAERTRHGRQTTLRIASTHGKAGWARRALEGVATFLRGLIETAEQLTPDQKWARILAHALRAWLKGRQLRAPPRLQAMA